MRAAKDKTAETGQVTVARDLLRLLPTHSFSLIFHLCAFFTQVPLCPENGITFEDIGCIFGPPIFEGPVPAAHHMMVWFLKCWNRISDGLLDANLDQEDQENTDGAAAGLSPLLTRGIYTCLSVQIHLNYLGLKSKGVTGSTTIGLA